MLPCLQTTLSNNKMSFCQRGSGGFEKHTDGYNDFAADPVHSIKLTTVGNRVVWLEDMLDDLHVATWWITI